MEHGSIEWQLDQAETALREIAELARTKQTKTHKRIVFLADHVLTHNTITRMAQQAGEAWKSKV